MLRNAVLLIALASSLAPAQSLSFSNLQTIESDPNVHHAFPRLIRARNRDLLLFYKVATSHAYDPSVMVMRRSSDNGRSWTQRQEIHRDPSPNHSATNTVPLLTPSGRIINWLSSFGFQKPNTRERTFWRDSSDNGQTWSAPTLFDDSPNHSTYYVTDAITTSDGMLACAATFPPSFTGNCWAAIWHSPDGRKWSLRSNLTSPNENRGDEVALLETRPGHILCLLRARQRPDNPHRTGLYRFSSTDNGRTWTEEPNMGPQLGCTLQRPFLTRLDANTVILSGRDYDKKLVVAYLSRDNAKTFSHRLVLDSYTTDGAYTAAVPLNKSTALITWYADSKTAPNRPGIFTALLHVKP